MVSYLGYPNYSGLSERISGLTEVLVEGGLCIKILAPIDRDDVRLNNEIHCNTTIHRIDLRKFRSRNPEKFASKFLLWLLFSLSASIVLIKEYIGNRCLIQYQSLYSAFPALMVKMLLGAQVVGDDVVLIHPFIDSPILRLSDFVVTPSTKTYSFAKRLRKFALYVPNGVEQSQPRIRFSDTKPEALFVGALSFGQNLRAVENIIRMATDLDKKDLAFKMVVVGGPLSYVEQLVNHPIVKKGKVKFLGRVTNSELRGLYRSSFMGLLPFFQDTPVQGGQRTKALEFFANCLLVISGPEGVKGIQGLKPGEHYLLARSLDEMCLIIGNCFLKPEKYQNIATAGASYVAKNYSWQIVTKDYLRCVQDFREDKNCCPRKL